MLWANNREMMMPSKPVWKNSLQLSMLGKTAHQDASQYSGTFGLGDFSWAMEIDSLANYPFPVPQNPPNPASALTDY